MRPPESAAAVSHCLLYTSSYGEVVGIVSAKYSSYSNTTVEGIGFAIPINDVVSLVKDCLLYTSRCV